MEKKNPNILKASHIVSNIVKKETVLIDNIAYEAYPFIISTESIDRHGERITLSKIELDNFRSNPNVYFNHSTYDLPIGRSVKEEFVTAENGKKALKSWLIFDETNPDAEKIKRSVDGGFLRAASIGFSPSEPPKFELPPPDKADKYQNIAVWQRIDLHEWSIVTIPANQDAVLQKNIDTMDSDLLEWYKGLDKGNFEHSLDEKLEMAFGINKKEMLEEQNAKELKANPPMDEATMTYLYGIDVAHAKAGQRLSSKTRKSLDNIAELATQILEEVAMLQSEEEDNNSNNDTENVNTSIFLEKLNNLNINL